MTSMRNRTQPALERATFGENRAARQSMLNFGDRSKKFEGADTFPHRGIVSSYRSLQKATDPLRNARYLGELVQDGRV